VLWSFKAIEQSEVAILMIDAQQGILAQDKRVANFIIDRHRGVLVVVNKWDGDVANKNTVCLHNATTLVVIESGC
jgi:GTPase